MPIAVQAGLQRHSADAAPRYRGREVAGGKEDLDEAQTNDLLLVQASGHFPCFCSKLKISEIRMPWLACASIARALA